MLEDTDNDSQCTVTEKLAIHLISSCTLRARMGLAGMGEVEGIISTGNVEAANKCDHSL